MYLISLIKVLASIDHLVDYKSHLSALYVNLLAFAVHSCQSFELTTIRIRVF